MTQDSAPDHAGPLTPRAAVHVLTAFVNAVNAGQNLSDQARFLALDAIEVLSRKVA